MTDSTLSLLWDSTRLRLLVEIEPAGQRLGRRPRGRDRPAERERAPAHSSRRAAGQRLVERNGRGSRSPRPASVLAAPREPGARDARGRRGGASRARRARGRHDPHRRLDDPRRLPAARHARLLPPRPPERHRRGRDRLDRRDPRPAARRAGSSSPSSARPTADERVELEPFLSRRDRRRRQARARSRLRNGRASPETLAEQTLLVREAGSSTRQVSERALARSRRRAARVWELDSSEAIKRAAREGLGVAFLSRYAVAEEIERGELASFRLGRPTLDRAQPLRRPPRPPPAQPERTRLRRDAHALLRQERGLRGCRASAKTVLTHSYDEREAPLNRGRQRQATSQSRLSAAGTLGAPPIMSAIFRSSRPCQPRS